MLIIFHYIGILIFQILQKRKRQKRLENIKDRVEVKLVDFATSTQDDMDNFNENLDLKCDSTTVHNLGNIIDETDLESNIKFDPPVFRQRYAAVYQTLIDERWRTKILKLCDFGCAEFGLFTFIKKLNRLNDILFVDIDEDLLKDNIRRIHPLTIEYLKRREEPLTVIAFAGSVGDPDYRILNTDVITAIELIEHLYPDVLEAFPYNVFNYAQPKLVIITTPNADFNVLFSNPLKFRHDDHKFEWTREQFQDWANNIIIRFPDYLVNFSGLGEGPDGTYHLGHCSQMALFIRKDLLNENYKLQKYSISCICPNNADCEETDPSSMSCKCVCPCCSPKSSYGICSFNSLSKMVLIDQIETKNKNESLNIFYKAVEKIEYPFERDNRSEEEKLMDEFTYRINSLGQPNSRFFVEERERAEIPLRDLLYGPDDGSITVTELSNLLAKHNYQIEKCVIPETKELETCVIFEPLMDNTTSSSEHSDFDTNSGYYQSVKGSLSDWEDAQQDQKEFKVDSSSIEDPSSESDTLHDALSESETTRSPAPRTKKSKISKLPIIPKQLPTRVPTDEQEETDLFEETVSTPSLSSQDNKVHLKRASNIEKTGFIPPPPPLDVNKMKLDFNHINELDRVHNIPIGRHFFGHLLRPPTEKLRRSYLRDRDCLPGPSNIPTKKRKKMRVAGMTSDPEDDISPLDDMKSVTNCIVENTLNKLNVDEVKSNKDDVIEFNLEPVEEPKIETDAMEVDMEHNGNVEDGPMLEGSSSTPISQNIQDETLPEPDIENHKIRLAVDLSPIEQDPNLNNCISSRIVVLSNVPPNTVLPIPVTPIAPNIQIPTAPLLQYEIREQEEKYQDIDRRDIARASREAIVDPNSVQDLLEDFDVNNSVDELTGVDIMDLGNCILIGIHPVLEDTDTGQTSNGFPHWLLQILGTAPPIPERSIDGTLEEPHYYCQGDGLGVHPSVIAVDLDGDDDDDDEHSSQSSNEPNTTDFAEIDPGSSQDISSLPEDSMGTNVPGENQDPLDDTGESGPSPILPVPNQDPGSNSSHTGMQTSKSI